MQLHGQRQVLFQHFLLLCTRREVAVEVQPAFTHGSHVRLLEQSAQALGAVAVPVAGRMRVNARRGEQPLAVFVQFTAQLQGLFAAFNAGAGEDQLGDASSVRTVQHGLVLTVETGVGQVDADIDELHGSTSGHRP